MKQFRLVPSLVFFIFALAPLSASGLAEGSIQKTWDFASVHTLVIDADLHDLIIKEGGPRITGRLLGESGDDAKAVREGDKLTLTARSENGWFSWRRKSARIELSVPPGMALDLTTASGAIVVQVSSISLRARSASGDIEAPRGGGSADVDSTSGTVRLKGFTGPIKANSLSGNLVLEGLAGDIQASTLSGNLDGENLAPVARSRFTTVSGNAELQLEGFDAYEIQAEASTGSIEIGDRRAEGKLTAGSGPLIVVKSVSGDIRVR